MSGDQSLQELLGQLGLDSGATGFLSLLDERQDKESPASPLSPARVAPQAEEGKVSSPRRHLSPSRKQKHEGEEKLAKQAGATGASKGEAKKDPRYVPGAGSEISSTKNDLTPPVRKSNRTSKSITRLFLDSSRDTPQRKRFNATFNTTVRSSADASSRREKDRGKDKDGAEPEVPQPADPPPGQKSSVSSTPRRRTLSFRGSILPHFRSSDAQVEFSTSPRASGSQGSIAFPTPTFKHTPIWPTKPIRSRLLNGEFAVLDVPVDRDAGESVFGITDSRADLIFLGQDYQLNVESSFGPMLSSTQRDGELAPLIFATIPKLLEYCVFGEDSTLTTNFLVAHSFVVPDELVMQFLGIVYELRWSDRVAFCSRRLQGLMHILMALQKSIYEWKRPKAAPSENILDSRRNSVSEKRKKSSRKKHKARGERKSEEESASSRTQYGGSRGKKRNKLTDTEGEGEVVFGLEPGKDGSSQAKSRKKGLRPRKPGGDASSAEILQNYTDSDKPQSPVRNRPTKSVSARLPRLSPKAERATSQNVSNEGSHDFSSSGKNEKTEALEKASRQSSGSRKDFSGVSTSIRRHPSDMSVFDDLSLETTDECRTNEFSGAEELSPRIIEVDSDMVRSFSTTLASGVSSNEGDSEEITACLAAMGTSVASNQPLSIIPAPGLLDVNHARGLSHVKGRKSAPRGLVSSRLLQQAEGPVLGDTLGSDVASAVASILTLWMSRFPVDWEACPALLDAVRSFAHDPQGFFDNSSPEYSIMCAIENLRKSSSDRDALKSRQLIDEFWKWDCKAAINRASILANPASESVLWKFSPELVAQNMALIDWQFMSCIASAEFLSFRWSSKSVSEQKDAWNIVRSITWFNQITWRFVTGIVSITDSSGRANAIGYFMRVALACYEIRNYSGVLQVACCLSHTAIRRLKKTWSKVSEKQWARYNSLMGTMEKLKNYMQYRQVLDFVDPPVVPYLGSILGELTAIDSCARTVFTSPESELMRMRLRSMSSCDTLTVPSPRKKSLQAAVGRDASDVHLAESPETKLLRSITTEDTPSSGTAATKTVAGNLMRNRRKGRRSRRWMSERGGEDAGPLLLHRSNSLPHIRTSTGSGIKLEQKLGNKLDGASSTMSMPDCRKDLEDVGQEYVPPKEEHMEGNPPVGQPTVASNLHERYLTDVRKMEALGSVVTRFHEIMRVPYVTERSMEVQKCILNLKFGDDSFLYSMSKKLEPVEKSKEKKKL